MNEFYLTELSEDEAVNAFGGISPGECLLGGVAAVLFGGIWILAGIPLGPLGVAGGVMIGTTGAGGITAALYKAGCC